jgi:shikimate kinase
MKRVLLTGMSGAGKSALINRLVERGYRAVDTDYHGLSHLVTVPDHELTGVGPGQDWVWREDRIQQLLSADDVDLLFLAGCAPNQGKFYPQFDHVILLTAPAAVIAHRLATRTTNPYGKQPDQLTRTLQLKQTIEPLLRRGAEIEIDTTPPLDQIVVTILRHVQAPSPYGEHGQPARPA